MAESSVRWLYGRGGLAELAPAWQRLGRVAGTAYARPEFARAWAQVWIERDSDLALLVLTRGESVVAIAPWVRWPGRVFGVPLRRWTLLGALPTETVARSWPAACLARDLRQGWSPRALLLTAAAVPGLVEQVLSVSRRELRADLLHVPGLPATTAIGPIERGRVAVAAAVPYWSCALSTDGAPFDRMGSGRREKRRLVRKLLQHDGAEFQCTPGDACTPADLEAVAALEQRTTKPVGASILTSGARNRQWFLALVHELGASLWLARLSVAGQLVAFVVVLRDGGTADALMTGYDPGWAKLRPGFAVFALLMPVLAAQGVSVLGLGRAVAPVLPRLHPEPSSSLDWMVYGDSVVGRWLWALHCSAPAKAMLRAVQRRRSTT